MELIACMQGVQAALNLGIGRLLLETDALMIVQAMNLDAFDAMAEGVTLEELKFLVRVNFSDFKCNFLSRVGNRAAHALAALGLFFFEKRITCFYRKHIRGCLQANVGDTNL